MVLRKRERECGAPASPSALHEKSANWAATGNCGSFWHRFGLVSFLASFFLGGYDQCGALVVFWDVQRKHEQERANVCKNMQFSAEPNENHAELCKKKHVHFSRTKHLAFS